MLLSEARRLYIADRQLEGFSPSTIKGYRIQIKLLIDYFGDCELDELTLPDLKEYLVEKGGHLKPSSLGGRIRALRAFFRWASEEGYAAANPARKLKEPKLGKRIPKFFTDEETERLRIACNRPMESALTEFFYSTGCRISEVQGLNISDINWERRSCVVNGKGDKQREVYFSLNAKIRLQMYLETRRDSEPALFVTDRSPHRPTTDTIRRNIKKIGARSEIDRNVRPHDYRHTFATYMLNKGAPLEAVQDQMGHAKAETTRIYCSLTGDRRKQVHDMYF